MNSLTNATIKQLEDSSESCERWAFKFAGLVVLGVIAEFVIAAVHPEYDSTLDRWGSAFADAFVAIGVAGEVIAGRMGHRRDKELTRRSEERVAELEFQSGYAEEKIAEAHERAAKAELETAKLNEQFAPREVTEKQFNILQELKGVASEIYMTTPSDFESTRYASQIALVLENIGIKVNVAAQRIGIVWTELYIVVPKIDGYVQNVPLFKTFSKAGFSVGCGDRTQIPLGDIPPDASVIMVGSKRPPIGKLPPFTARLPMVDPSNGPTVKVTDRDLSI